MSDLYHMLSSIARRRKPVNLSPFANRKTLSKWLLTLPQQSEYDTHHALVEGLERYNAEPLTVSEERLQVLLTLEEIGLPLQARIVDQYVHNQASFKLAKKALWRESHLFWTQLAYAWLGFFKQVIRDPAMHALSHRLAGIATRTLRYTGLAMRWEYHQELLPASTAWCRLNKIYRLAERGGYADQPVVIDGVSTHCTREFALIHLLGLVHPAGYRALEIEGIAQLFAAHAALPLPTSQFDPDRHSHVIDLAMDGEAFALHERVLPGKRLRYLALQPLLDYLKQIEVTSIPTLAGASHLASLGQQLACMIERGGARRNAARSARFSRVWVASGMDSIMTLLTQPDASSAQTALEPWMVRDESSTGMGLGRDGAADLDDGQLLAVCWDSTDPSWQIMAVRWLNTDNGQCQIGTQRLTRHPKLLQLSVDVDGGSSEEFGVLFMPLADSSQGVSNLLIPASFYQPGRRAILRDGGILYRLRLGAALEKHAAWVRVEMDVLAREYLDHAA
jgi:hypothetical protein